MTSKVLFTLNVDDYAPEICALTHPLLRRYADKIGAEFIEITKRKYAGYPVTYEKLQIHELGRRYDWIIYFDSDCLVHPDLFDVTEFLPQDTVLQNARDVASNRFTYDEYFRRDGRHIGACNWFTVASRWCLDLWRPLEDLTISEAVSRIHVQDCEERAGITAAHLIDDYVLSRNIARFGLKHKTFESLSRDDLGQSHCEYFWHEFLRSEESKLEAMRTVMQRWFEPEKYIRRLELKAIA